VDNIIRALTVSRNESELALARAEMTMFRWMCGCGVCQVDRYSSVALRDRLGLEDDIFCVMMKQFKMVWTCFKKG